MNEQEKPPIIDAVAARAEEETYAEAQELALELLQNAWFCGFNAGVDFSCRELRANENHQAADIVARLRRTK